MIATRIAVAERALRDASTSSEDKKKFRQEILNLTEKVSSIEDMVLLDEMIQSQLEK